MHRKNGAIQCPPWVQRFHQIESLFIHIVVDIFFFHLFFSLISALPERTSTPSSQGTLFSHFLIFNFARGAFFGKYV